MSNTLSNLTVSVNSTAALELENGLALIKLLTQLHTQQVENLSTRLTLDELERCVLLGEHISKLTERACKEFEALCRGLDA